MAAFDARTALIVVDLQNDFADPGGGLYVPGGEQVVGPIDALASEAVDAGGFVVHTQDWHPPHTPHFAQDGGVWPVHCVQDTWGAALVPGLRVQGPVVRKGAQGEDGYSGFTMRDPVTDRTIPTPLDALLRERGIRRVVVCGLATDHCVRATALDARQLGYEVSLRTDLVRAVDLAPGDGQRAIEAMSMAGVRVVDRAD